MWTGCILDTYHYCYKRTFRGFTCFTTLYTAHKFPTSTNDQTSTRRITVMAFRHLESTLSGSDPKDTQSIGPNIKHTRQTGSQKMPIVTPLNSPPLSALNATKNIITSSSVIIAVVENIGGRFSGSLRRVAMMLSTRSTEFHGIFQERRVCGASNLRLCWT